jgi:hypothetical protein
MSMSQYAHRDALVDPGRLAEHASERNVRIAETGRRATVVA